jgi:hypothetical protein
MVFLIKAIAALALAFCSPCSHGAVCLGKKERVLAFVNWGFRPSFLEALAVSPAISPGAFGEGVAVGGARRGALPSSFVLYLAPQS